MALLNVHRVGLGGSAPTFVSADGAGDEFPNTGRVLFVVKNDGIVDITVTIESQKPCNYGFDHDVVVTVPAGGERWIGPFLKERFNDATGKVRVLYSDVTSISVAAVEVA